MPVGVRRLGVGGTWRGYVSDVPASGGPKADKGRRGISLPLRVMVVTVQTTLTLLR